MAEFFELSVPEGAQTSVKDLWTPDGLEYIQSWVVGPTGDGHTAIKHEFKLTFRGEEQFFGVLGTEDASDAQIEDLAADTAEAAMVQILEKKQKRGDKLVPEQLAGQEHWDARRELAAIFRDYVDAAKKRAETTTGRRYKVVA